MKYNKKQIMTKAWELYRMNKRVVAEYQKTFAECLKRAWSAAKEAVEAVAEAAKKGIVRMHYAEYKNNYSDCQTVENSYDKRTKTIEVMTKVLKAAKIMPRTSRNGLCPFCRTWCYGDCRA